MNEFRKDLEDYFCKFTFGQFVTLILLELVTLFFVFYLGARYGPDLIGPSRKIAAEEQPATPQPAKEVQYTFPETLTGDSKGAIRIKPSGVTAEEYETRKRSPKKEEPVPVIVPAPERLEVAVTPEPALAPKVDSEKQYAIQVGSFRSAGEAAGAVEAWKKKGYSTFMTIGEVQDKGTWYRVRIGRFATKKEADEFLKRFMEKEGKKEALVVLSKG